MPAEARGLMSTDDPHFSFTQVQTYLMCPGRYKWEYIQGNRQQSNPFMDFGGVVHRAIEHVNHAAKAAQEAGDTIAPEDIETALEMLAGWGNFAWYQKACEWVKAYAERIVDAEEKIISVEEEFTVPLEVTRDDGEVVTIWMVGRMDLKLRNQFGERIIREFKTWGSIPSQEDLEGDIQTAIYDAQERLRETEQKPAWKQWWSVLHDAKVEAKADAAEAENTMRFIGAVAKRMMNEQEWPETINTWCRSCGKKAECKVLKRELKAAGVKKVEKPTLAEYDRVRARAKIFTDMQKSVADIIKGNIEENGGEPIVQNGMMAKLRHVRGGSEVSYTTKPFTAIDIKKVKGDNE